MTQKKENKNQKLQNQMKMIELTYKHPKAHAILSIIQTLCNTYKSECIICSYDLIKDTLKISRQTVITAVQILKKQKHIFVYKIGNVNIFSMKEIVFNESTFLNSNFSTLKATVIKSIKSLP